MSDNFKVDMNKATPYDSMFAEAEHEQGLPSGTLKLVAMIENRNNIKNRVSPKQAAGIMQIMPENQRKLGVTDPNDPKQSIRAAALLLKDSNKRYNGDLGAMLADYNGGPKRAAEYLEGKSLNPETANYLKYAAPFMEAAGKPSKYAQGLGMAMDEQVLGDTPSEMPLPNETQDTGRFAESLNTKFEKELQQEAEFFELSISQAAKAGFRETMTAAIGHVATREDDPDWNIGEQEFDRISQSFPGGLDETSTKRLYNSRSASDFDYNINRVTEAQDFAKRLGSQAGLSKAAAYATVFAGSMADPAAMPLGTFGVAGRVIKGGGAVASIGRAAVEGTVASAVASPVTQYLDKGSISTDELMVNMAAGAVMGAGIGAIAAKVGAGKDWTREADKNITDRFEGAPEYTAAPKPNAGPEGDVVNFRNATDTSVADDGAVVGIGPTEVVRAATGWDESVDAAMQATQARRAKYYGNATRQKLTGWADSEGVRLAQSENKVSRFVGAMWAGNSAGLGKVEARTAAVLKDQLKEQLDYTYIPELKSIYEGFMTSAEKYDYMAGGAKGAQARFSREVQLERYRHREYRMSNENSSKGYQTEAPAAVQRGAQLMDELYSDTKAMHMQAQTEHAAQLKDSDPIGYIEQRPDYIKLQSTDMPTRKAFLSMVKDDYHAEATAKMSRMREEKTAWIEETYATADKLTAEGKAAPKWVDDFLADPDKYFEKHFTKLSEKIHGEMDKRASHWWDNALSDPEARYQNSEASLVTLAKEMSAEWFTGREVDASMVEQFQKALTEKWADTSRRELRMSNSRKVNGEDVYLLDMFQHDVFNNTQNTISDTAGRVGMAKMGWKTEQDIADTLSAMQNAGASTRDIEAAKHISDLILNRAKGLDNAPLVQAASNITHAAMMGKLATSLFADLPTIIGNLGLGGMGRAMGDMAKQVVNGELFVKNGRKTALGNDLDAFLAGLNGHDHELWIPQTVNADGMAMEVGGSILRRSQAAARMTNTLSFANAVSRSIGTATNRVTNKALHNYLRTGKGIPDSRMADIGMDAKLTARVKAQFDQFSGKEDFGLDKWSDPYAKEAFISAAHRFVNQNRIDHQAAGELPKWTRDNMLGVLFGRFRTIGIRAQEKILVRNLTHMDSNAAAMLVAGLAFTTLLAYGRIHLDAATSKDGKKVLKDRLTPMGVASTVTKLSSITGLSSEGFGILELMTGGGYQGGSDTPLTGAVGNITGALGKTGEAITGNDTWSKAAAANFKLLPGSNTYMLMGLQKALSD